MKFIFYIDTVKSWTPRFSMKTSKIIIERATLKEAHDFISSTLRANQSISMFWPV